MNNSSPFSQERPSRRQPKQKRGKERVRKILLAAAEVFTEVGYSAATIQQIADRANTAIGSIYQFFPDKLAIFHALEEEHYKKIQIMSQSIVDSDINRSLGDLIGELIDGYGDFLSDPISLCVVFQLSQPHVPGLFVIWEKNNETLLEHQSRSILADFYQRRNPSLSRDKSELLSEVTHHTFRSLFFVAFKSNDIEYPQVIFAELKDLLYGYLDPYIGDRFIEAS